jgi:hypothetical protein
MFNARVTPLYLRAGLAASILMLLAGGAGAQAGSVQDGRGGGRGGADQIGSIDDRTRGFKKLDGFAPLYWDEAAGRLWMELPKLDTDVLYSTGIAAGLGSNDIGIDRGALAGSRIIRFERVGPRVLVVQPNLQFRAITGNPAELRAVREGFARSVLWSFQVAAASGDRILVDATDFLVRDSTEMAGRLEPGSYRFEANRSSIYLPMTQNFPKNTEMEVELTFVRQPGPAAAAAVAGAGAPSRGSAASRPQRRRPASACITRSSSSPTPTTSRARTIPDPATAPCPTRTSRRLSGRR